MSARIQAIAIYESGGDFSSADIAELAGVTHAKARSAVSKLVGNGLVTRVGGAYPPKYRLSPAKTTVDRAIASRPALQQAWGAL